MFMVLKLYFMALRLPEMRCFDVLNCSREHGNNRARVLLSVCIQVTHDCNSDFIIHDSVVLHHSYKLLVC